MYVAVIHFVTDRHQQCRGLVPIDTIADQTVYDQLKICVGLLDGPGEFASNEMTPSVTRFGCDNEVFLRFETLAMLTID